MSFIHVELVLITNQNNVYGPSATGICYEKTNIHEYKFSWKSTWRNMYIYLFIYLKIRTMYRGENNRTRSPLLGSPSYNPPTCSSLQSLRLPLNVSMILIIAYFRIISYWKF